MVQHTSAGLDAAALFLGDILDTSLQFLKPGHTQLWLPYDCYDSLAESQIVFSNLVFMSTRQLHRMNQAEPQLPVHLCQIRGMILSWLCPMLTVHYAPADDWLLQGIAGWLMLIWVERTLGIDQYRLTLQRIHDTVVSMERNCNSIPVSRGSSFAREKPSVDLGIAGTEDPLLSDTFVPSEERLRGLNAKATLLMHMIEQRLGDQGRDILLQAICFTISREAWSGIAHFSDSNSISPSNEEDAEENDYTLDTQFFFDLVNGKDDADANYKETNIPNTHTIDVWLQQWVYSCGVPQFKCSWEYSKSKNEIDLTIEQIVPNWRRLRQTDNMIHHEAFQGLILIRIVEIDQEVFDHTRMLGAELRQTFSFKCHTKTRVRKKSGTDTLDDNTGDCPILWVKVDPDYAWAREISMQQRLDSWVEQLDKDGETDAQVNALKALAEFPATDCLKTPAILADVVRGASLTALPSEGVAGEISEEHAWPVRAEAAMALARWQLLNAPQIGVASPDCWRGRDFLKYCLTDLFFDEASQTPLPIGMRVIRGTTAGDCSDAKYRGSYASTMLYIAILESVASVRALNGATPLDSAQKILEALNYADEDMQADYYIAKSCRLSCMRIPCNLSFDKSLAIARLLTLIGDVHFEDDILGKAKEWRIEAQTHAQRYFEIEYYRQSYRSIVGAAALQAIISLRLGLGRNSHIAPLHFGSKEYSLKDFCSCDQPECIRLVALFGLIQQAAISDKEEALIDALLWVFGELFDRPIANRWLQQKIIKGLIRWMGGSFLAGGILANVDLFYIDQTLPGIIGCSSGWKSWYNPEKATGGSSKWQVDLAKHCHQMVLRASGFHVSRGSHGESREDLRRDNNSIHEKTVVFVKRLWSLANDDSAFIYDQDTRSLLQDFWNMLFPSGRPSFLTEEAGAIDSEVIPSWARGALEGILNCVRRRKWAGRGIEQPKKKTRLILKNTADRSH